MTDSEYRVLDELYFVIHYKELADACGLSDDNLIPTLKSLYNQKWIRIMVSPEVEEDPNQLDLDQKPNNYYYLATKKGLFAHHSSS